MPKRPPRKPEPEREGLLSTGVKKTIWFHEDEAEALRLGAFKGRRSESPIVREAYAPISGLRTDTADRCDCG